MLVECCISIFGLYDIIMCSIFAYDVIRNDYNCCKKELEYVVIDRECNIIPTNDINVETLFTGYPKPENEIIGQRIS
jgi:hypothetical protein